MEIKNKGNRKQRQRAADSYYMNPSICKYCGNIIHIEDGKKIGETKKKKFCNSSCAASYNNIGVGRNKTTNEKEYYCFDCGKAITNIRSKRCHNCHVKYLDEKISAKRKCEVVRMTITKHARRRALKSNTWTGQCDVCGYDKHVEVCHVKPVCSFSDDATLNEINDLSNLRLLCPNHHWEFDNNILE